MCEAQGIRRGCATLLPPLGVTSPAVHRLRHGRVTSMAATPELIAEMVCDRMQLASLPMGS